MSNPASTPVERVYFAWNDALSRNGAAALLARYAPDAVFESPLVPQLFRIESGVFTDLTACARCSTWSPSESRRFGSTIAPAISRMAND